MKWLTTALALMASTSLANPIPQETPQSYGSSEERPVLYNLKVKASAYPDIHEKYLSISEDQVGIFKTKQPLVVTTSPRKDPTALVSLHTWPIGIVDHALVVTGQNGLFDLKDSVPELTDPAPDSTYSWREFVLDDSDSELGWRAPKDGKWVVFPGRQSGTYEVKWNDETGFTTQNFLPISITFEKAEDPEP